MIYNILGKMFEAIKTRYKGVLKLCQLFQLFIYLHPLAPKIYFFIRSLYGYDIFIRTSPEGQPRDLELNDVMYVI